MADRRLSLSDLHVAGLMLPGLPFVAVGRNPWIAWGGTAAHAASSDLFDLSSLQDEPVEIRREVIRVRGARSTEVEIRISRRFGPVISDAVAMVAPTRCVGLD